MRTTFPHEGENAKTMKKHTLLTGALTAVMAFTGLAQAQSSARQERFEAFVQARISSAELPLSALTRRQQANFGVAALVFGEEELFSLGGVILQGLSLAQLDAFFDDVVLQSFLNDINRKLRGQRLDLDRNDPRRIAREFTTIRDVRRSGLIMTGSLDDRLARPEFTPRSLRDRVSVAVALEPSFFTLGTVVTTAQANATGAELGNAAFDFFGPRSDNPTFGGLFPEDFRRRDFVSLYQANTRRTARVVRELLAINPNFNPAL